MRRRAFIAGLGVAGGGHNAAPGPQAAAMLGTAGSHRC